MAASPEKLLEPVAPESPCGEDLSYDPAFGELERLAQGTPEQQVGDTVIPATDPNWGDVERRAADLFSRTKDLRVGVYYLVARIAQAGTPGMAEGLAVLQGLLTRYWDDVYPRLDPDDGNDPTERMNIVAALAPRDPAGDPIGVQRRLRAAPLTNSRQLGKFGLRDVLVAEGELPPPGGDKPPPDTGLINGAFEETPLEELQAFHEAAVRSKELVQAINTHLTETVGSSKAPDLTSFEKLVEEIARRLAAQLQRRGVGVPGDAAAGGGDGGGAGGGGGGGGAPLAGDIRSPGDVVAALDRICRYYEHSETSSPIPVLARAAQRLIGKSFSEIVRSMNPDVVRTVEQIGTPDAG